MARVFSHVRLTAAIIAGKSARMDQVSRELKGNLVAEAARHKLTGAFMNSFVIETVRGKQGTGRRVSDRLVGSPYGGAKAINYGHFTHRKDDPSALYSGYVPGKHIFEKAIARTAR